MDPDDYCRCRYSNDYYRCWYDVIFSMLSIFPVTVTFPAAPMARKDTAGSGEQGDNAY
jgi:hypothetical protein